MARNDAKTSHSPEKANGKTPAPQTAAPARNTSPQASAPARNTMLTQEQIARRAYEIFLARGGQGGSPEQDWFQAERELRLGRQ